MRLTTLCLLTLLALAACTGGASPAPVVVTQAAPASLTIPPGWLTYTDPETGFTIHYPPDAHFSTGKSKTGVHTTRIQFRLPGVHGYQGMVIRAEPNPGGQGAEQILETLYRRSLGGTPAPELLTQFETVDLAGLPAIRTTASADNFTVVLPYRDWVYTIAPVHDMLATALDPAALELFNEVLRTFVLTYSAN